ncbi:MAG: hypothetical protein M3P49_00660 [Actinomycetota bacterium]|nr:hypothetical protein [Actinomycetota bacterium]
MSDAADELKRRCLEAGVELEEGDESEESWGGPGTHTVSFRRGRTLHPVMLDDDATIRLLLREPFEKYVGLTGLMASWSPEEGVIECNVENVDPAHSSGGRLDRSTLRNLGLEAGPEDPIGPDDRVEFDSDTGLSISIGPTSDIHGILTYNEDFLEYALAGDVDEYRNLTLRIRGARVRRHDDAVELLRREGGSVLSRINSSLGLALTLERWMGPAFYDPSLADDPALACGRTVDGKRVRKGVRLPLDALLFWGKTLGVTGNGPYEEMAIEKIVSLEGGIVGDADVWQTNQMVVVGREGFDEDYLVRSVKFGMEQGFVCRYLSQEDFWTFWLGAEETTYYEGDPRIREHEGLSFLASIGFAWPSAEVVRGLGGTGGLADRLNETHLLKSRFGYSVRQGVSVRERRQRLARAVQGPGALGLQPVASHIAGLIGMNSSRYDDRMLVAIERWQADLDWLRASYYEGKAHSFVWPEP